MSEDFRTLLQKPLDTVKRPPPLPAGTYYGVISSHSFEKSSKKQTPFVRFNFTLTGAGEDVDPAMLEDIDLSKRTPRSDFYITEDALYRLKEFLNSVGVETAGRGSAECIPETANARVVLSIIQHPSEDGKEIYNEVREVRGQE